MKSTETGLVLEMEKAIEKQSQAVGNVSVEIVGLLYNRVEGDED